MAGTGYVVGRRGGSGGSVAEPDQVVAPECVRVDERPGHPRLVCGENQYLESGVRDRVAPP
jgi:hypothetical protein